MQVVIDDTPYKRKGKRKKIEDVTTSPRKAYDPNLFDLIKLSPEVLAEQVTVCDIKRFKTITPRELRSRGWEKKQAEKLKLIPNIYKFTTHFNQISYWVAGEILKECSVKLRAEKISYFIKMAKCLDGLNNYHSLMAVAMGLNLNAIFRLHSTWEAVHKRDKAAFKSYVSLCDLNWRKLKDLYQTENLNLPFLPHLGPFLQDLSGINSHPKLSKPEKEKQAQTVIQTIQYFQESQYEIPYVGHIQDYLASEKYILELQRFVEDDILKLSFEREPLSNTRVSKADNSRTVTKNRKVNNSRSLEDITFTNPLFGDETLEATSSSHLSSALSKPSQKAWKPGHRKTNSLSILEGFNNDQERAGTAILLDSPVIEKTFTMPNPTQNLIDDSWEPVELQRNRSLSEPPSVANCLASLSANHSPVYRSRDVSFSSLGKINEIVIEGVLLKKTCLKFGKQPKLRRWKAFYCVVSDGKLSLYLVKGHRSSSGIGQSSTLKKCINLAACTVTMSYNIKHDNVFTVADLVGNIYKFKDSAMESAQEWVNRILAEKKQYPMRTNLIQWEDF